VTETGISIAMATFNGAEFLREQLDSLAGQSRPPSEMVVCDDGSTDETVQIVRSFAATAPFQVRIEENDCRLGYADNFLKAASLCSSEWISFCDQDDVWLPHKLARVAQVLTAAPEILLTTHSAWLVNEDLTPTGRMFPRYRRDCIVDKIEFPLISLSYGFTTTFRAILLRQLDVSNRPLEAGIFPMRAVKSSQAHDELVFLLANSLGAKAYISEPLALYRRHHRAVTGRHSVRILGNYSLVTMKTGAKTYEDRACWLEEFADFIAGVSRSGVDLARLQEAVSLYSRHAADYRLRRDIYLGSFWIRIRSFVRLVCRRCYAGGMERLTFGRLALIKDMVAVAVPGIFPRASSGNVD